MRKNLDTTLEAAGIVNSWTALRYKIEHNGFPTGRYIGPNSRAWTAEEVQQWIDARPTLNPRKALAPETGHEVAA